MAVQHKLMGPMQQYKFGFGDAQTAITQLCSFLSLSTLSQSRHFHSSSMLLQQTVSCLVVLPSFWHLCNISNNLSLQMKHLSERGNVYIALSQRGIYTPRGGRLKWFEAKWRVSLTGQSDHVMLLMSDSSNSPGNDSFYDDVCKKPETSPLFRVNVIRGVIVNAL